MEGFSACGMKERRRVALDLHDSTAQTLAALALNLTLIQNHKEIPASPGMRNSWRQASS